MFKEFVNNKCIKKHRNIFSVFLVHSFVLLLVFSINSFKLYSQNNFTQFDINDPRNPDCPCHKRQKLAEDEYMRISNSLLKKEENNFNKLQKEKDPINGIRTGNKSLKSNVVKRCKKRRKEFFDLKKLKFRIIRKAYISKHTHTDYSVCYKW
jgi:hypothetical protein